MSDRNEQEPPKSVFFSPSKIIFLMAVFIFMVQNEGYVNLILIFCIVMFCIPSTLVKLVKNRFKALNLSDNFQKMLNHWYEKNVINKEATKAESKLITTTKKVEPEIDYLAEARDDLFNFDIPEPPLDVPPYPTLEEIWGPTNENEVNNDGQ